MVLMVYQLEKTQVTTNTTFAIVEQSVSESMAPIFSAADISISTGYSLSWLPNCC